MSYMLLPTVVVIGGGRVGKTLAHLWVKSAQINLLAVCNRHLVRAEAAVQFIGVGQALETIEALPFADLYCITTTDDAIGQIASQLVKYGKVRPGTVVLHCSGCYSVDLLQPVAECGGVVVGVHPIYSFADSALAVKSFAGCACGYEGDDAGLELVLPLFESIGARLFALKSSEKSNYHAGLVMASNYAVSLLDMAIDCLERAGVDRETALPLVVELMGNTVENVKQLRSTKAALTGPIARGDTDIVRRHLEELAEPSRSLYQILGQRALQLSDREDLVLRALLHDFLEA